MVSYVSAAEAVSDAAMAARILLQEGALVVRQVCPHDVIDSARMHVDAMLNRALSSSGESDSSIEYIPWTARRHEHAEANHRWFSNVDSGSFRRDLRLELCPPVLAVLSHVLGPRGIGGALAESPLTAHAQLCELAALISDKGARAQRLHADTRDGDGGGGGGSEGHRVLFTCFIALQDVTEAMGPTWIAPRTHCGAAHEALANLDSDAFKAAWGAAAPVPLKKGDVLVMDSRVIHGGGANDGSRRALMYCSLHAPSGLLAGHSCSMLEEYRGQGVTFQLNRGGGGGGGGDDGGDDDGVVAVAGGEGGAVKGWEEIASKCKPPCYDDE